MVLAKLADYEHRFADPGRGARSTGYEPKPVRWVVDLSADGRPAGGSLSLAFTSQSGGGERARGRDPGKTIDVPHISRSSGNNKPKLLADDDEWVFGVARKAANPKKPEARDKQAKERHDAFLGLLADCASETGLPEVQAVLTLLERLKLGDPTQLPEDLAAKELITFRVDGQLVVDLPQVREFWGQRFHAAVGVSARMRRTAPDEKANGTGLVSQCLVCGQNKTIAATHPDIFGIPGGSCKLVSFTPAAFTSYGLGQSHNSPVCVICAQAYARGLNRLLASEETRLRLGGIAYAFWTREPTDELPVMQRMFNAPKPEEVRELLKAAIEGGAALTRPQAMQGRANAFYAAGFTRHEGRAVMLNWLETTVDRALVNLARYFALQTVPLRYANQDPFFSLGKLVGSLSLPPRPGKGVELDSRALDGIVQMALNGGALPDWILFQAVRRNRAPGHRPDGQPMERVSPARAALIQLVLASQGDEPHSEEEILSAQTRESPAFLCGRLLAVLEWAQREAIGNPNTTIVDRFYGSASSAPASVFGVLMRNGQAHLGKLRREKRGLYVTIERQLEDILGRGLQQWPSVLTLKDQAVFALGYYYQRANHGRDPN